MDGLDDRFLSCLQKDKCMYISWLLSYLQGSTRIPVVVWMNRDTCAIFVILHGCTWKAPKKKHGLHVTFLATCMSCHTWEETHYFGYPVSISNFVVFPFHQQITSFLFLSFSPNSGVNQDLEKLQSLVTVTRFSRTTGCFLLLKVSPFCGLNACDSLWVARSLLCIRFTSFAQVFRELRRVWCQFTTALPRNWKAGSAACWIQLGPISWGIFLFEVMN